MTEFTYYPSHENDEHISFPPIFDLAETLDCGQAFRWEAVDDSRKIWHGVAFGKYLKIEQTEKEIVFFCSKEDFENVWRSYFDLDTDYEAIKERLSALSPVLKEASDYAPGIRILRQDPWEAVCSFIISQNNNIPRIKGIVNRLCENFGEKLEGTDFYTFPSAEKLAALTPDDLAPIRSGFRAKYIISGAESCANDHEFIPSLFTLPIDDARAKLKTVKGIGPKVADCALLYGFHRMECFPVDTWMKKAMAVLLPDTDPVVFGMDAGIAQQYIFHYSRMHPELFE
ncbi:MAG: DNA glycosylase [Clostridia bacterium]|nr:DNA glycosylase [Clostridia bacterium]